MRCRQYALLWTAAASALSSQSNSFVAHAFVQHQRTPFAAPSFVQQPRQLHQRRLYSSKKDSGGILGGLQKVAKSVLPTSWFQSEEEKKAAIQRQRVKDEVSGGLKEILKDAPLPVRMLGGIISPIMSNLMSGLAETMEEQQASVEKVLTESQQYLMADAAVGRLLGDPIQVGTPFSQSSSTTSINGNSQTRVQISFPVQGGLGSGVAVATATEEGLQRLELQAGGRVMQVSLSSSSTRPRSLNKKWAASDDDIIEAEIVEKNVKP